MGKWTKNTDKEFRQVLELGQPLLPEQAVGKTAPMSFPASVEQLEVEQLPFGYP